MRSRVLALAAALILAPLGAKGADLVVWWEEGWYPEEERAVADLVAAFEDQTGVKVELVSIGSGHQAGVEAALGAGQPPDFLWGFGGTTWYAEQWAYDDRLLDLDQVLVPCGSYSTQT